MAIIVFYGTAGHGHINPTLPLVAELVRGGDRVIYYATDEFKEKILATGASFRAYPGFGSDTFEDADFSRDISLLYFVLVKTTHDVIDALLCDIREIEPDLIIHDSISVMGRYAAEISKIPAVSSISTFAFGRSRVKFRTTLLFVWKAGLKGIAKMREAMALQAELRDRYGVEPRKFLQTMMNEEGLNIVYTSRLFQPSAPRYPREKYEFVGPSIASRMNDPDRTDYSTMKRPLIYVSMGTVWKDSCDYGDIAEALEGFGVTLVFSGKRKDDGQALGDNVIEKSHVNQLEVLKHCDVFITHGGMNSVSEGIRAEVPLCVFPFQAEQAEVAERVAELGCGIRLRRLEKGEIRKAVSKILSDDSFKENCRIVSKSFAEAGGYQKAAEMIREFANRQKASPPPRRQLGSPGVLDVDANPVDDDLSVP